MCKLSKHVGSGHGELKSLEVNNKAGCELQTAETDGCRKLLKHRTSNLSSSIYPYELTFRGPAELPTDRRTSERSGFGVTGIINSSVLVDEASTRRPSCREIVMHACKHMSVILPNSACNAPQTCNAADSRPRSKVMSKQGCDEVLRCKHGAWHACHRSSHDMSAAWLTRLPAGYY